MGSPSSCSTQNIIFSKPRWPPSGRGKKCRNKKKVTIHRIGNTYYLQQPELVGYGVCPEHNVRSHTARVQHTGTRTAARFSWTIAADKIALLVFVCR